MNTATLPQKLQRTTYSATARTLATALQAERDHVLQLVDDMFGGFYRTRVEERLKET